MIPILSAAPGFILLAIAVGMGAYVRTVYIAAEELEGRLRRGEVLNWHPNKPYTKSRIKNLGFVQGALRVVTLAMFVFIILLSSRLTALVTSALPKESSLRKPFEAFTSNEFFYYADFWLLVYLTIAFVFMFAFHLIGSYRELSYREAQKRDPNPGTT